VLNRWLKTEAAREYAHHLHVLNEFAYTIVDQHRLKMNHHTNNDNQSVSCDLLTSFMTRDINDAPPTDKFLRDVVMSFIIAGRDAVACNLTWTTYLLSLHQRIGTRVSNELNGHMNDGNVANDALLLMNRLRDDAPLTDAVLHEALRLYPSIPIAAKVAVHDDIWPGMLGAIDMIVVTANQCLNVAIDGTHVDKGTIVFYHPYIFGRSAKLWQQPDAFLPHR
jgi:cytochrome P450